MERWSGKLALVTGASAGIGAAIAVELVKNGLKVVAVARRLDKIEELKKELGSQGDNLYPLKVDITQEEDIEAAFQWVKDEFGTINVLINNAGIIRYGKLSDQDPKNWRDIMNVNVIGLSICTQQALKLMKESGVDDGQIIHINSVAGHKVPQFDNPVMGVYPASKYAVTALTETLRQELNLLGSKIRITSVSPGFCNTEIVEAGVRAVGDESGMEALKVFTEKPALKPEDVAGAVVYVLSTPPHVQVHELIIKPIGEPE